MAVPPNVYSAVVFRTGFGMSSEQNLIAYQGNDTPFQIQVLSNGLPLNITGYTLKLYVKASNTVSDSQATVYTTSSGLTVNAAAGGTLTWVLPHGAAGTPGTYWWRLDITDTSATTSTAVYGQLAILAV